MILTRVTTVPSSNFSFLGTSSYPNTLGRSTRHAAQYTIPAAMTPMPTKQYLKFAAVKQTFHGTWEGWRLTNSTEEAACLLCRWQGVGRVRPTLVELSMWAWIVVWFRHVPRTENCCCQEKERDRPPDWENDISLKNVYDSRHSPLNGLTALGFLHRNQNRP